MGDHYRAFALGNASGGASARSRYASRWRKNVHSRNRQPRAAVLHERTPLALTALVAIISMPRLMRRDAKCVENLPSLGKAYDSCVSSERLETQRAAFKAGC